MTTYELLLDDGSSAEPMAYLLDAESENEALDHARLHLAAHPRLCAVVVRVGSREIARLTRAN